MSNIITSSSTAKRISSSVSEIENEHFQIFLGGSCNPTTWRQNVAIPFLEMNGISYYNPQVDDWTPEVVNTERYAKQNAQVLLFVIDKQTRSTVSLIESAFMAGQSKKVVLVIYPFEYNIIRFSDKAKHTSNIIETRSELMTTSRFLKKNINNECSSSSFMRASSSSSSKTSSSTLVASPYSSGNSKLASTTSISTATTSTRTNLTSESVRTKASLGEKSRRKLEAKHEKAEEMSSTIEINGEVISLSEFDELRQARCMLQNLVASRNIPIFSDILQALKFISDDIDMKMSLPPKCHRPLHEHEQPPFEALDFQPSPLTGTMEAATNCLDQKSSELKDIYLSLDGDDHTSIESSVLSILQEKGLTYNLMFVKNIMRTKPMNAVPPPPRPPDLVDDLTRLSFDTQSLEISNKACELTQYSSGLNNQADLGAQTKSTIERAIGAIRGSRVLLFVITNRCRGLSIMVLASHFMALFRDNIVLCLQYLEEPCLIGGEELTKTAIADYNRGRVYLSDYATKTQVPVFNSIHEAIECCSKKCRFSNKS